MNNIPGGGGGGGRTWWENEASCESGLNLENWGEKKDWRGKWLDETKS